MAHAYIAFHQGDGDFVGELIAQVEGAGIVTWADRRRAHLGDDWKADIDQAIRAAFALILVITPGAMSSRYVAYEWALALGMGKPLVAVLRRDSELHPRLMRIDPLDFRTSEPWGDLVHELRGLEMSHTPVAVVGGGDRVQMMPAEEVVVVGKNTARVAALMRELREGEENARVEAAEGLGGIGDAFVLPALREALEDDRPAVRGAAAVAMGRIGDAGAVSALLGHLQDDRVVRLGVIWALGRLRDSRGVADLVEVLQDADSEVRRAAAEALGTVREQEAVAGLLKALGDSDEDVRKMAAWGLGRIRQVDAMPGLLEALRGDDRPVRDIVIWALGEIAVLVEDKAQLADVVSVLVRVLDDEQSGVRLNAAWALGTIGDARAVPGLLGLLGDSDVDVRWAAAEALEEIGEEAVPGLVEILEKGDDGRSEIVVWVLERIGTAKAEAAVKAWRESPPP